MLRQLLHFVVQNIDGLIPFTFGALMALQGGGKIPFSRDPDRNARLLAQYGARCQKGGAAAMAIGILFMVFGTAAPEKEPTGSEVADAIAQDLAAKLPRKLDEFTTLETVTSSEAVLTYQLRLSSLAAELADDVESALQESASASVCSTDDLARLLALGVALDYVYRSTDSVVVAEIRLTSQDCEKLPNPTAPDGPRASASPPALGH